MARIIAALLCHGDYQQLPDTPSALQPFPLTANGERQARGAAMLLRDFASKASLALDLELDCSSALNAWQSARIIATELADCFASDPNLCSYHRLLDRSLGTMANLSCRRIEQLLELDPRYTAAPENWLSDSNYRLPCTGAESLMEAGDRCASHISQRCGELQKQRSGDTLKVFVGHADALLHAAFLLGVVSLEQLNHFSLHKAKPIFIERDERGQWQQCGGLWKKTKPAEQA